MLRYFEPTVGNVLWFNMPPLGNGRYFAFSMPDGLRRELEEKAGIAITCLKGLEIAKAAGGVHCLTRPVYA